MLRRLNWLGPTLVALLLTSCGDGTIGADRRSDAAPSSPPGPAASGEPWIPIGEEWTAIGTSESDTLRWTIFSTPGTGNAICFAFEFEPPRTVPVAGPPGIPLPPVANPMLYKDRDPSCSYRRADMDRTIPVEIIFFPNEDDTAPYNVVIGQVSEQVEVETLRATFNSGTAMEIVVGDTGLFVLPYLAEQRLVSLTGEQPPIAPGRPKGTFGCAAQTSGGTSAAEPQVRSIPGCSTDD